MGSDGNDRRRRIDGDEEKILGRRKAFERVCSIIEVIGDDWMGSLRAQRRGAAFLTAPPLGEMASVYGTTGTGIVRELPSS
jgi:hypothetical protein